MGVLVLLGFGIANLFYTYQNNSVDPRIVEARDLYSKYDSYVQNNDFIAVFNLLDSIEAVYAAFPYYQTSFEIGVVQNNRAAAYLSMAIFFESNSLSLDGLHTLSKDSLLTLSERAAQKSISYYENWLKLYGDNSEEGLKNSLNNQFLISLENYSPKMQKRFVLKRIKEMKEAQIETPRRLSVAYTNRGIVYRHRENYKEAIVCYAKALELWDRNLAAENNLNKLMGKPVRKQNMFQKIFPPEKDNIEEKSKS
jgi:tetratricopeptide (TPR) repeat protein